MEEEVLRLVLKANRFFGGWISQNQHNYKFYSYPMTNCYFQEEFHSRQIPDAVFSNTTDDTKPSLLGSSGPSKYLSLIQFGNIVTTYSVHKKNLTTIEYSLNVEKETRQTHKDLPEEGLVSSD